MPPKKQTGENIVSKKSFTLIWWVEEGSKDIIPASKLPRKNCTIGSIVKLKWETFETKQIALHDAKIIAFDTNYEKLNNILLDDKGNIRNFNDKLFINEVLQLKRKTAEDNKNNKKSKVQRINSLEDELSSTPSLFASLKSNIKSSKLPVLQVSTGPLETNIEVIGNPMILDESQSSRSTQSQVNSSSNNREFQLIDCSKENYDVSTKTNGTAVEKYAAANTVLNYISISERSPPLEPLDFSKANDNVFIRTKTVSL
ncbi:uncharacterized protein LOC141525713 [Cotesia typhae]|uniref:uncharacterized protein LOC141525713 n=1 Tax=Cotesia typhae TaxID=2053667 RepID=UPI003D68E98C